MMSYAEVLQHMQPIVREMNERLSAKPGLRISIVAQLLRPVTESEVGIVVMSAIDSSGGELAQTRCHLLKQVTIPQLRMFLDECEQKLTHQLIGQEVRQL